MRERFGREVSGRVQVVEVGITFGGRFGAVKKCGSVAHFVGDFSMIFGAVKVFDDDCGGFGIRPQRGASYGSKATPLLV
jgi:hypothetical protein